MIREAIHRLPDFFCAFHRAAYRAAAVAQASCACHSAERNCGKTKYDLLNARRAAPFEPLPSAHASHGEFVRPQ